MREVVCLNCGKRFMTESSAQKHCSIECRRIYNGKKPELKTIQCAYCGKLYNTLRKCKYCSVECRNRANGKAARKPQKPAVSIVEIARLARECGLSYGEYVAKYNC